MPDPSNTEAEGRSSGLVGLLVEPKKQITCCYEDDSGRVWFRFSLPGSNRWVDFLADPYLEMLADLRGAPERRGSYGLEPAPTPTAEEPTDDRSLRSTPETEARVLRCARCCQELPEDIADREAFADPEVRCGPACCEPAPPEGE